MPSLTLAHDERLPGVTVITVSGELDATNRAQLDAYVKDLPAGRLVFDLSGVPFMDSSALHVLLMCDARCRREGGSVRLAAVQSLPARLFEITGVLAHVPVHGTVEDAVAAALGRAERSV
ncbi:Anti-sigma-B factor antagonist [Nonomuraea coxensis DSM 45129]|uniref:Anti-sigma factor antagonist n=1 Tax=Nonomuraea coxensis DSM 45129 TaxID=1122611 RepID=A0ABX8U092_9ACTN|nr:STAS domain-containing protein [Nonomuraea coxensis]QYC41170.1 Anti-sigma-B factor antagonist [Nonomuraea coxensis DSM 45129]